MSYEAYHSTLFSGNPQPGNYPNHKEIICCLSAKYGTPLIVQWIRVKIALNVVKASKLVQMKLIT